MLFVEVNEVDLLNDAPLNPEMTTLIPLDRVEKVVLSYDEEYDALNDAGGIYIPKRGRFFNSIIDISAAPRVLTAEDLQELEDRFGKEVRTVVEDMISGEEKRWEQK